MKCNLLRYAPFLCLGCLGWFGIPASAAVIAPMSLNVGGSPQTDQIDSAAFFDDEELGRFWTFSGLAGQDLTVDVERLEDSFDPYLWVFQGLITDTDHFLGGAGDVIDSGDPGYLHQFDGGGAIYLSGSFFPDLTEDVLATFTLPSNDDYTLIVTSNNSGEYDEFFNWDPADGGDGLYDYQISAAIAPAAAVPEPSTAVIFGIALSGLVLRRLHRRTRSKIPGSASDKGSHFRISASMNCHDASTGAR